MKELNVFDKKNIVEDKKTEQNLSYIEAFKRISSETNSKINALKASFGLIFLASLFFIFKSMGDIETYQKIFPFWAFGILILFAIFSYFFLKILVYFT